MTKSRSILPRASGHRDALAIAKDLWKQTHTKDERVDAQTQSMTVDSTEIAAKN
jgi:hypothetical protein